MGLCESTLPQLGRTLRPQEKGNDVGWLVYMGQRKGEMGKYPHYLGVHTNPCTEGTHLRMLPPHRWLMPLAYNLNRRASVGNDILRYPLIIFVVGGPGCGKGTQCRNMALKYGFYHVELGQLLREEAQRSTQRGRQIRDIMQKGLLVPTVGRAPNIVIVFDCSMETMVRRVLRRGQVEHRADDSEPAIRKRLETHYTLCEPVLTFYQQKNLLRHILAEEAPESIFAKCCSVIESLL